jgi:HlyD family secretion protein
MPRWLVWSLAAAIGCAALLWLVVLSPETVPVKVVPVETGRVEATLTNTKAGTLRARRRAKLSAQMAGQLVAIEHRAGDAVRRGDVLVRLDDATQRAQVTLGEESLVAAEAARREACVRRDRARRELERKRELAAERIVSEDLLDQLESAHAVAEAVCARADAEVGRARAQLAASRVELAKMSLQAPFDGVIAEVDAELGEWITPSPPLLVAPPVVDLIDPGSVYVSAPMDEVDAASIRAGQEAKVTVDSHPGRVFRGRVARVAPYVLDVEAQNRTVEIEVELLGEAPERPLLPGTSADVEVVREVREPVLRIPTSALLEGNRVLVARDGRLEEREVSVGLRNWDYAEILEGLRADQRVVVSLDRVEVQAGARVVAEEIQYRP